MPEDKTTIKGEWWRAGQPEKRLPGQIAYGALSGAQVDIFGNFEDNPVFGATPARFTLHGQTNDNKSVTLFDCLTASGPLWIPGRGSSTVRSIFGVVGDHFLAPADIKFKQVIARFAGLRDWVWVSGLSFSPDADFEGGNATYRLPPMIPLGRIGRVTLNIEFTHRLSPGFHSLSIDQDCTLHLETDEPAPYSVFEECINSLQQLLTLAIQRSTYAQSVHGRFVGSQESRARTQPVDDCLIIRSRSRNDPDSTSLIPQDCLFTCQEIGSSPAEFFMRFVERQGVLGASMDLYFTTVHQAFSVPRVRFITLATSLEAYHRASEQGQYLSDTAYQEGLRKLLWAAIPKDDPSIRGDFLESLDGKLDHLHEYSLRKRLKDLASKHRTLLEFLIGAPGAFAAAVAERRNRMTHPTLPQQETPDDLRNLWLLCEKMALLLEVCFLDELGFAPDRLKAIVTTRSRRARLVHQSSV